MDPKGRDMKQHLIADSLKRAKLETSILSCLKEEEDLVTKRSSGSARAIGDAVSDLIGEKLHDILGESCTDYSAEHGRRSVADLDFRDLAGFHHVVDVKTHNLSAKFSMPNLVSTDRLLKLYERDDEVFSLLIVKYEMTGVRFAAKEVILLPIEHLSWSCLRIGALGKGQIQIAKSSRIVTDFDSNRKEWMLKFCENLLEFYPKEASKIQDRIKDVEHVQKKWLARQRMQGSSS